MLLESKNAVIYGAGGAVGGAVARAFAREGAKVFLTGRTLAPVAAVVEEKSAAGGAASRTVLPLQELRAKLGMEGKTPDEITEGIQAAYTKGDLPRMETVAFAYMFSADQYLGPRVGAWHPHMMVYTPYYDNSMLGGNQPGTLPIVGDDAGPPFAVTVIPVARELAVKANGN